jgi:hypothetical protein
MGFSSGSNQCSAASHEGFSASATESHARPPNAIVNQSHLRPMSAVSQPSLSSRPWSAMSRSSFVGARLLALDSLTEGPGMFQGEIFMLNSIPCEHIASLGHANSMIPGARRRPASSECVRRPSSAISGRILPSATLLHQCTSHQNGVCSDSDDSGAKSPESILCGSVAGHPCSIVSELSNMEPNLSPRATIAMERRLWKVHQPK